MSRPSRAIRFVPAGLALLALSHVDDARAQALDESRSRADALFNEGQQLISAGQLVAACAKLEESQRLDPKLGRLLNVAYCHEQLGRTATAWAEYNQAAAVAQQTKQSERVAFAHGRAAELASKLSFIRLDLPAGSQVSQISVDGRTIGHELWAVPFPIDPGAHTVTFEAPASKPQTESIKVADAETVRVVVGTFEPAPATPAPQAPPPPPSTSPSPPPEAPAPAAPAPASRTPGWIVGGIGVVGLGVGTGFAVRSLSLKNQADPECKNKLCTPHGTSLISDATTSANIATAAFAVGLVGVAAGTFLVIHPLRLSSGSGSGSGASARITPQLAADRAGLLLDGAW
jgi:hypothetical protein